jgi:hypothetical protein
MTNRKILLLLPNKLTIHPVLCCVPSCFILYHNVQVLAAVGPMAAITSSGMTTGFTPVLLPQLQAANCFIPVTDNEAYWIGKLGL